MTRQFELFDNIRQSFILKNILMLRGFIIRNNQKGLFFKQNNFVTPRKNA